MHITLGYGFKSTRELITNKIIENYNIKVIYLNRSGQSYLISPFLGYHFEKISLDRGSLWGVSLLSKKPRKLKWLFLSLKIFTIVPTFDCNFLNIPKLVQNDLN